MPNALARSTSPYLLQHADNPVDWREWGDDAFAEAERRDVPVLLSVGYAACHWCHVMAHESFEDPGVAALIGDGFVAVKVDREERPDVDAAYMAATTALTGQGGWPMTVFLRPDGAPFHAGTYHPPAPVGGRPSFTQVLAAVRSAWVERRAEVDRAAAGIAAALADRSAARPRPAVRVGAGPGADGPGEAALGPAALEAAVAALAREEDVVHGGFGGAPKFPPSPVLGFLLRHAGATTATDASRAAAAGLAGRTLDAMVASGTYDQVAGGFARYAVDAAWRTPHFEKMLYDNAQLARACLHRWRLDGDPASRRAALETCDWMLAALGTARGALASSLDADTVVDGRSVEGATYVWTPAQLSEALGAQDGAWAAELLGVDEIGSFEHGASTLVLTRDPWADAGEAARWGEVRERLRAARAARAQPARDDKVVAAWNGLAISALAETGALCGRADLVVAAERVADVLLEVHRVGGSWRRTSRDGVAGGAPAVLEDLGCVADGFLALHAVTGRPRWARAAEDVLEQVLERFADDGVLHDTAADAQDPRLALMGRPADPADAASPSGASAAAGALLTWAALTGSSRHRRAAQDALAAGAALAVAAPRFAGWALAVAQAAAEGPVEVAIAGGAESDDGGGADGADGADAGGLEALALTALAGTSPGLVVARPLRGVDGGGDGAMSPTGTAGAADVDGTAQQVPLLDRRTGVDGRAAAYVCRDMTCRAPTTSADELAALVGARPLSR